MGGVDLHDLQVSRYRAAIREWVESPLPFFIVARGGLVSAPSRWDLIALEPAATALERKPKTLPPYLGCSGKHEHWSPLETCVSQV
ncbi:hypothetical protein SKAU_G00403340 [Synaphobranchus kaupii]|uniref:Uncharacterized protein n=1 Tax=Synaphobranchus kaupii TaxID=118154 RepID=A0A9Q1IBS1_SYNKA|nr:hypothetical protein SKAU_G00403340 [Synaphobranchus kaupii]